MIILPAIDLIGGKCVRLKQGRYDDVTVYNDSPLDQAFMFKEAGASWIHVVDLDAAKSGVPENHEIIKEISVNVMDGHILNLSRLSHPPFTTFRHAASHLPEKCSVRPGFLYCFRIMINPVNRICGHGQASLCEKGSDSAEWIKNLCTFFQIRSGQFCRQGRKRCRSALGNCLLPICKSIVR